MTITGLWGRGSHNLYISDICTVISCIRATRFGLFSYWRKFINRLALAALCAANANVDVNDDLVRVKG